MQSLDTVRNLLLSVSNNVFHYWAEKAIPPYIVWAEDGASSLRSDNWTGDQSFTGLIHLFTKTEDDPLTIKIQSALNQAGIAWRLESVQYETDTRYIHYAWAWGA